MKKADIQIGVEYAFTNYGRSKPEAPSRSLMRGIAVEKDVELSHPYAGGKGIRFEHLNDDGRPNGHFTTVQSFGVVMPWADYVAARARIEAEELAESQRQEADRRERCRLGVLFKRADVSVTITHGWRREEQMEVRLSKDDLYRLVAWLPRGDVAVTDEEIAEYKKERRYF